MHNKDTKNKMQDAELVLWNTGAATSGNYNVPNKRMLDEWAASERTRARMLVCINCNSLKSE
jgi:hypothetical protein